MTKDQVLERYLQKGYKQVFYSDSLKVLIQASEDGPYVENRSDLIYFQSIYIVSYYKNDSEYKFNLFIRIKYNHFVKKVANIIVHIDDHKVDGKDARILSPKILNILMVQTSVCYNHLLRSALDITLR